MSSLPTHNRFYRFLWTLDSWVSSALFESWDWIRRWASSISSFLYRFKITGVKRFIVDLLDDGFTFVTVFAFLLLANALPPFSGTGDVWNKGREYAMTFTDAKGEIIGRRGIRQDDAIALEDIPPQMIKAVLATEDARFFDHFGVDIIGTLRAIVRNTQSNNRPQGGSSITQQVAKNLFLSPERTIQRKVHEAFLALWIEARLSKPEILKLYLDRSYLGGGNYGVEAAAQFYFGKSVRDVTLSEAAMLAGLFKAPTKYAPHQNIEAARMRANVVLYRMLDSGFITQGELLQSRREPAQVFVQTDLDSPDWYLDWAYHDALAILEEQHLTTDYVIEVKTTIDRKLQAASQKILNAAIDNEGPKYKFTQAASITMAPDGAIKAIIGGRQYEDSQFNRATSAERQTGSAFKPFVYLAALLNGYTPDTIVLDAPVWVGNWSPQNYTNKYAGRVSLTSALAHSYNSVPVRLMQDIGRKKIIETSHLVGIQAELENWAPMVLGTSALTLLDVTSGYATFAGGGKLAEPYTVLQIKRPNGDIVFDRNARYKPRRRVVSEEKIAELNSMLMAVVKNGTARRADLGYAPQGGKTGTNQSYRDAWYIGFTAHNVTGVWVGNDDFSPMDKVTGGLIPAPLWKQIMDVAETGLKPLGLAGIPLDKSYSVGLAPTDTSLQPVADEVDPSASPVADNSEGQAATEDPDAVLKNMFSLFEKEPVRQRPRPKKAVAQNEDQLILPEANVAPERRQSFLQSLFGRNEQAPRKKRKKRVLMDLFQ